MTESPQQVLHRRMEKVLNELVYNSEYFNMQDRKIKVSEVRRNWNGEKFTDYEIIESKTNPETE